MERTSCPMSCVYLRICVAMCKVDKKKLAVPLYPEKEKKGEVNHKKIGKGNRKMRQQGKLPFLADVTTEPCQERLGWAGGRAQLKLVPCSLSCFQEQSSPAIRQTGAHQCHTRNPVGHCFHPNFCIFILLKSQMWSPHQQILYYTRLTGDNHQYGKGIRTLHKLPNVFPP